MGSHQRRARKRDRKRLVPTHVQEAQEERSRKEQIRRKNCERKRRQRAREQGDVEQDRAIVLPSLASLAPATLPPFDEHEAPSISTTPRGDLDPSYASASHGDLSTSPPRVWSQPSSSSPFFSLHSTTPTTPFSSHTTTPIGVVDSSPYFTHLVSFTPPVDIPNITHPPSFPSECTTPRSSPHHPLPIDDTLSPHLVAPIVSPSSPVHVHDTLSPHHVTPTGSPSTHAALVDHDEETAPSPPVHVHISSGLPSDGRFLSRTATRSHAQQITATHFHGYSLTAQVRILEELHRLPLM